VISNNVLLVTLVIQC